jgi:hypothetical protein
MNTNLTYFRNFFSGKGLKKCDPKNLIVLDGKVKKPSIPFIYLSEAQVGVSNVKFIYRNITLPVI